MRQYRWETGMTQEVLAERAGLSVRCLSDLERGVNLRPRRDTINALIRALQLSPIQEGIFRVAARPVPGVAGLAREKALTPQVLTVLLADIRGYTRYLLDHGNEAGAALAMRFASLAQLAVEPRGGQLVELRGDEVLAVFPSVRQAVYAAVNLQQQCVAVAETTVPVGIGLDAGELVEVEGGGLRGLALNLAARLCSQAEAGEILVSETVQHLAHKLSGLSYRDRGNVFFHGFPEPLRVYQVLADVSQLPEAGLRQWSGAGVEELDQLEGSPAQSTRPYNLAAVLLQAEAVLAQLWRLLSVVAARDDSSDGGIFESHILPNS
jgi:class 3 adenylate cyclase